MLIAGIVFIILLALGMPVAFGIGIAGLIFYLTTPGVPTSILPQNIVAASQSFTLLAIPLFIFAGNLMKRTCIIERLVSLVGLMTVHMYESLVLVSTVLSTFLSG